jgi:hypothetical protein
VDTGDRDPIVVEEPDNNCVRDAQTAWIARGGRDLIAFPFAVDKRETELARDMLEVGRKVTSWPKEPIVN